MKNAPSLSNIKDLQEVEGFASKYVYKIGEYRIGLKLKDEPFAHNKTLVVSTILNMEDIDKRKDIHRLFS